MAKITVEHIDGKVTYEHAPEDIEMALRRRFDNPNGIAAKDPDQSNIWLFDVRNWWDGPSEVIDNGNGTLTYRNPWTGSEDTFSV